MSCVWALITLVVATQRVLMAVGSMMLLFCKGVKKRAKNLHISEFHEAAVIYSLDTETNASTKQKASKDLRPNTSSFAVFTCSA